MIVIGGATATGKTALGVQLAKRLNGEIVSADSMQIYKYMDIGTAKPTEEEKEGVVHHLIDIVEPDANFSVAEYKEKAEKVIEDIKERGKTPIIVGGTGLYINALIYDYKPSERNDKLREELQREKEEFGVKYMYEKLCAIDPKGAKSIHPNNLKRVLRALEVMILTGKSIADKNDREYTIPNLTYICDCDRDKLYQKINLRVEKMFEKGLLKEVECLLNEGKVSFDNQSMQAIGYKEFKGFYNNEKQIEEVKNDIKQHTRNYAKRQNTWFKRIEDGIWLNCDEPDKNLDRISNDYYQFFCKL